MRESQPHSATCYRVATDFPPSVEPQALLPASDHHINCLVDSAHSTNCLAYPTVCTVPESMVGKAQAKRLEENVRSCRNCRPNYSLPAGIAAVAADIAQHDLS